ncbi:protealysin inhibitor emfourin [Pacificoceanicola onchidii]|uniref:protealysin inhibitor emfourin n=1 Tax=Pacificoceanicola onchidii TaxID=2562685 RepID=UPI0010A61B90|nr:protealysin inhibitor emfourin [Pacificoceanicola onchidii]
MDIFSAGCLVVLIEISKSGGFGGLAVTSPAKSVTLADLPEARAQALCEAFDPAALRALSDGLATPGRADTLTYEITVTDHAGRHPFVLDETQLSPHMLDLIDDVLVGK